MLKQRSKLPTYNDGIVYIYREKTIEASFGAKINPESLEDLDFVVKLNYSSQSVREQDFVFAEARGISVATKIKTHLAPGVDAGCKAIIGDLVYDVSYIDQTRAEMFLYLEGGAPFGNDE